jgi:acetyl esterase/lipase
MPSQEHETLVQMIQARPTPESPSIEELRAGFETLTSIFQTPDNATRVAERATQCGVDVTLEPWEGFIHVWQAFGPTVPESQEAVARIGEFIRKHAP